MSVFTRSQELQFPSSLHNEDTFVKSLSLLHPGPRLGCREYTTVQYIIIQCNGVQLSIGEWTRRRCSAVYSSALEWNTVYSCILLVYNPIATQGNSKGLITKLPFFFVKVCLCGLRALTLYSTPELANFSQIEVLPNNFFLSFRPVLSAQIWTLCSKFFFNV